MARSCWSFRGSVGHSAADIAQHVTISIPEEVTYDLY